MIKPSVCAKCGRSFKLDPSKRGYANHCPTCSMEDNEVSKVGGNMIWDHKTAPYIEIKSMRAAKNFERLRSRGGYNASLKFDPVEESSNPSPIEPSNK